MEEEKLQMAAATARQNNASINHNSAFEQKRAFTDNPNHNNRFYRGKFLNTVIICIFKNCFVFYPFLESEVMLKVGHD